MFSSKEKTEMPIEKTAPGNSTTLICKGTTIKGDIDSITDIRIDGTIVGNIVGQAKVVIGTNGTVEGDIKALQVDVVGKVFGNINAQDLLQLRGNSAVNGNLFAGKLQVEPAATFNGQCHMGAGNVVEMNVANEQPKSAAK